MKDIKSMTLEELTQELAALGEPAFRAGQIYQWMHRGARSFDEMTNLSKPLRERLKAEYALTPPEVARKLVSAKDHKGRPCAQAHACGNARPGAVHAARFRSAGVEHRAHGHRRAAG